MLIFGLLFGLALSWATARTPAPCPPGITPVQCFVDPCKDAKCPKYPDAECVANYCYGCNADFYVKDRKVNCGKIPTQATVKPPESPCPPGVPIVRCKADPCQVNTCPRYPNAQCRANYCGGCNAIFYVNGRKVNCKKPSAEYQ